MADDANKTAAPTASAPSSAKAPAAGTADSPKLTRGTVARGRTVLAPTDERRIVGYGESGAPLYRAVERHFGPGQEVNLPEEEILHLRRTGFLVNPDAAAANYGGGPDYGRT